MSPLETLALLPLGFWLLLLFHRARRWPGEPPRTADGLAEADLARVVAIVPARNEAEWLPRTLPSLLGPADSALRVVLVDDGSEDGTAEVAREVALSCDADHRLRVIAAPPAPSGWTGKLWALECGVAEAARWTEDENGPDWLLLTDADILHRRGSIAGLVARGEAVDDKRDLVSVMARLRNDRFWEKLLIPSFLFFFHLLYPFRQVADRHHPAAAAAGGCILLRPAILHEAGGFEPIRAAVIDDVALARRVADVGGRLWLGLDPGVRSVRPYADLAGVWRVIERTAFVQLRYRLSWTVAAVAALLLLAASPPWLALAGAVAHLAPLDDGPISPARAVVWASLAWTLQAACLAPWVRHQRLAASYSWALPFAALLYALMTASSAWRGLRGAGAEWKGRFYPPPAGSKRAEKPAQPELRK